MAMKTSMICIAIVVLVFDLLLGTPISGEYVRVPKSNDDYEEIMARKMRVMVVRRADTVEVAGSSLPDCSHACGSCSPCRLVMVSFICASLAEAETCPISYRCMCNRKSYPIP